MQQATSKKKLIKYGVIISLLNIVIITSALVLYDLYYEGGAGRNKIEKKVEKTKVVPLKPKRKPVAKKKVFFFDKKKRRVVKKICIVNIHRPECRKPDLASMPAELKDYYNYDPIKKVWVWSGGK